jgi:Putative beta barrel porin-7 (BBP7)
MRRKMLGSVAIWLTGGVALAADGSPVQVLGLLPGEPVPPMFPLVSPPPGGMAPGQHLLPIAAWQNAPADRTARPVQPIAQVAAPAPTPLPAVEPGPGMDQAPIGGGCASCNHEEADTTRWFGSIDYLLFWVRRNPTPPLIQVLPASLANFEATGGALPPNAATTVFGAQGTDPGSFNGVRAQLGLWLTPDHCWGVDGSYFQLFRTADSYTIASPGVPVLGRGFIDAGVNSASFLRYTTPDGLSTGFISASAPVELYSFDLNVRRQGPSVFTDRVDYLAGVRYLNLRDAVTVDSGAAVRADATAAPFNIFSHESFRALNEFYGAQVGFDSHSHYGCWTLDLSGKAAFGWVHQQMDISGFATTQQGTAAPVFLPNESILYVQKSNAGRYSRDRFAVVPEVMVKLGYQVTPHIRATIGYDIITVTSVERAGAGIDPIVNPSLARFIQVQKESTVRQPAFGFSGTDFWAQGLTAGITVTY